jgi:CheY-like chemotaxis protein
MCAASKKLSQPILIVEDSREDYETTVRAFQKAGVANSIYVCEDGDEALDYLYGRGKYANGADAPRPGVILLDLNLPGTDGREVLATLKADDDLKRIPVIVLTTSSDERDIENCYAAGANSYIQKPLSLDGYFSAIQRLKDYWYEIVVLPKST